MFRLTHYLCEILNPTPIQAVRAPSGPVVIWNLIRRCNLSCKHCYSISGDVDFPGELSTADVLHVMDDLKAFRVPVLILSGGEPLMRRDIFAISARAKSLGFYVGLSSNGTRFALVSIWEVDGALIVYDAATFVEIKRIPMSRPSGKYNVWNKITFSDGTSH